jgi:hypothetical protein
MKNIFFLNYYAEEAAVIRLQIDKKNYSSSETR